MRRQCIIILITGGRGFPDITAGLFSRKWVIINPYKREKQGFLRYGFTASDGESPVLFLPWEDKTVDSAEKPAIDMIKPAIQ